MKKIVWSLLATVAGVILLFSYRTSLDQTIAAPISTGSAGSAAKATTVPAASPSASAASPSSAASAPPSSAPAAGSGSTTTVSGLKDGAFTGQAADTPYGPVQVKITVAKGVIAKIAVPQYPNSGGRDREINSYALPQLMSETISAQNAQIDMVSGATYTSQGYLQSLQSALDSAHA